MGPRHKDYQEFTGKVQTIIIGVLKEEKGEREKTNITKTFVQGYDDDTEAVVTGTVTTHEGIMQECQVLDMLLAIKESTISAI